LKFKVEKLEKRWVVYFFPQIPSSWRLFNHHTRPSVFCILCKSPFGELVQFRLKREKTPCTKFFAFARLKTFEKSGICNLISNPQNWFEYDTIEQKIENGILIPQQSFEVQVSCLICNFKKIPGVCFVWQCKNQHWCVPLVCHMDLKWRLGSDLRYASLM
jgi:hypothetical protein